MIFNHGTNCVENEEHMGYMNWLVGVHYACTIYGEYKTAVYSPTDGAML